MKHINDLAHQLAISDVHLSMENARTLEHLNSRWKVLQVEFRPGSVFYLFDFQECLCLNGDISKSFNVQALPQFKLKVDVMPQWWPQPRPTSDLCPSLSKTGGCV